MKKTYRSAQGRPVNLDAIIVLNEDEIAVGNMNVNARGDELGPGGKVVKTRNQVMEEYYKLNTPVAVETPHVAPPVVNRAPEVDEDPYVDLAPLPEVLPVPVVETPVAQPAPVVHPTPQEPLAARRPVPKAAPTLQGVERELVADVIDDEPVVEPTVVEPAVVHIPNPVVHPPVGPSEGTALRGSLADSVAKTVTVNQTVQPAPNKAGGVKRI